MLASFTKYTGGLGGWVRRQLPSVGREAPSVFEGRSAGGLLGVDGSGGSSTRIRTHTEALSLDRANQPVSQTLSSRAGRRCCSI